MSRKTRVLIIFGVLALILFGIVFHYRITHRPDNAIHIGAILPLTGQFANAGNAVRAGLEFAAEKINAKFPNRISIDYYDTKSEAKNAIMGYNRLKSLLGIHIFFTTLSDHSLILKPMVIKEDDILFCIASHSEILNDAQKCIFQLADTSKDEAECLCDAINSSSNLNRVYYYGLNTDAGIDFERTFHARLGNRLVGSSFYDDNYEMIKNIIAQNSNKQLDCILVVGYAPAMGYLIRTVRESGYEGPIWANVGYNTKSVIESAGAFATTVHYVDYDFPYASACHHEYDTRARQQFGTSYNALSYLAMGGENIVNELIHGNLNEFKNQLLQDREFVFDDVKFKTSPTGSITVNLILTSLSGDN